jgi:hypothetical protein
MLSGARWLFLALIWIYLAAILYQVFLAGMGLFGAERDFELHRNLGYLIHLSPIPIILVAAVARVGSRLLLWTAALFVVQAVQPLLPSMRADFPWAAALHPVLALVLFWLGVNIGLQAWQLVRAPAPMVE